MYRRIFVIAIVSVLAISMLLLVVFLASTAYQGSGGFPQAEVILCLFDSDSGAILKTDPTGVRLAMIGESPIIGEAVPGESPLILLKIPYVSQSVMFLTIGGFCWYSWRSHKTIEIDVPGYHSKLIRYPHDFSWDGEQETSKPRYLSLAVPLRRK